MRAPVAPSGWPSEMPPPFGLMSSQRSSSPASCANWSTTDANASFTSITAMSSQPRPAFASARSHACGLPCSITWGSTPAMPKPRKRPRGSSPSSDAFRSDAISIAAAPSTIWLELPAVTLPFSTNAGLSDAILSADESRRTASSVSTITPTCGFETSTGTSSLSKRPSSIARAARSCERSEYASSASRDRLHRSAITSAEIPCGTISQRSSTASDIEPLFEPIGTRDIISTPPETTRSSCPDHTARVPGRAVPPAVGPGPRHRAVVRAHRDARHHLDAARDDEVELPRPHRRGRAEVRLHRRAALAVGRRAAHGLGPAGGERRVARDVPRLLVDLRHAAELDVLDPGRVDVVAADQPVQHLRREVVGADRRERPVAPPDRAAHRVDDEGVGLPPRHAASLVRVALRA